MSNWVHIDGKITLNLRSKGTGNDFPIKKIIEAAAPRIMGVEGSTLLTINPREHYPIKGDGDEYYHEAEVVIYGDLRGSTPNETYDKIVDFVNYLTDKCNVHGEITLEEDNTVKIGEGAFVRTTKTFEILSRR